MSAASASCVYPPLLCPALINLGGRFRLVDGVLEERESHEVSGQVA